MMARTKQVDPEATMKVHEVTMVHVSALNPSPYNPRQISPAMMDSLKEGIRRVGFVEPVVVQRQSPKYGPMIIVGGHQRVRAVREICIEDNVALPSLPAVVLDLDDRSAKLLNVSLNNVSGTFDVRLLGEVLEDIHHVAPFNDADIRMVGLEDNELRQYLKLADPPRIGLDEEIPTFGQSVTLSLSFSDTKVRDAVKAKLAALGEAEGKSTGDIVMGLLERRRK
jgi:ParB-like chromosome segregation protein Spo0J